MPKVSYKKSGFGLTVKSIKSHDKKRSYIFFKEKDGSYHAFVEVAASSAAVDCDPTLQHTGNTRSICKKLLGF